VERDYAANFIRRVDLQRKPARGFDRSAGRKVEAAAMEWADQNSVFDRTLAQRRHPMSTSFLEHEDFALPARRNQRFVAGQHDLFKLAFAQLIASQNSDRGARQDAR